LAQAAVVVAVTKATLVFFVPVAQAAHLATLLEAQQAQQAAH
jgi:hypothetical protein